MKTGLKQYVPKQEVLENRAVQDVYRLVETADRLSWETCIQYLDEGTHLEVWEKIDSTNKRARQLGEDGAPEGAVVAAEVQTAGRGRRGRSWEALDGTALLFSFLLRPSCIPEKVSMVTLVAAAAVSAAIDEAAGIHTKIKWPNDIVYEKKKLCGILTEMSMEGSRIRYVVVGIGINVSMETFPEEIADKAVSLYLASGKYLDRARLLGLVMKHFKRYYAMFEQTYDLSMMRCEYESKLAGKDDRVYLVENGSRCCGICRGITDKGALCIEYEDGRTEEVISGEVSVRGIYGYI